MTSAYVAVRLGVEPPPRLLHMLEQALPFEPDRRMLRREGSLSLIGFFRDDALAPAPRWVESRDGAAVVVGYGIDDTGSLGATDALRTSDVGLWDRFRGEWSTCVLTCDGLRAVASRLGTEPIYLADFPQLTAISNRARLIWRLMRAFGVAVEPDFEAMAPLLGRGYPACTDATAVRGVRLVDAWSRVVIRPNADKAQVVRIAAGTPPPASSEDRHENKASSATFDELATALRSNVTWLSGIDNPVLAGLTGGKDSRLVLGMLESAGLTDRVDFYISAPAEHADFIVARSIAASMDLRFERVDPRPRRQLLDDLRRHVALTEGALNAWDLSGAFTYHSRVGVHGVFGELYRGRQGNYPDVHAASRALSTGPMEFTGVLQPAILSRHRQRVHAWLVEQLECGVPTDPLADTFYARQRLPRWAGHTRLGDGLTALVTNPLYHPAVLRAYQALTIEDRNSDRMHFELMARLCPRLLAIPFAMDRWDPAMVRRSTRPDALVAQEPIQHAAPLLGTGWQLPAVVTSWSEIRERVEAGLGRLDSIVQPRRVRAMLDVCEIVLGIAKTKAAIVRVGIKHPRLWRRALHRRQALLQQILGLLTLIALDEELRCDPPLSYRVDRVPTTVSA